MGFGKINIFNLAILGLFASLVHAHAAAPPRNPKEDFVQYWQLDATDKAVCSGVNSTALARVTIPVPIASQGNFQVVAPFLLIEMRTGGSVRQFISLISNPGVARPVAEVLDNGFHRGSITEIVDDQGQNKVKIIINVNNETFELDCVRTPIAEVRT